MPPRVWDGALLERSHHYKLDYRTHALNWRDCSRKQPRAVNVNFPLAGPLLRGWLTQAPRLGPGGVGGPGQPTSPQPSRLTHLDQVGSRKKALQPLSRPAFLAPLFHISIDFKTATPIYTICESGPICKLVSWAIVPTSSVYFWQIKIFTKRWKPLIFQSFNRFHK